MSDYKAMDVLARVETQADSKLAVAFSGGADSTALLVQTHRQHPKQVIAFHVHHGLQAAADDFELHCQALCDSLQIPLYVVRVNAKHASGESPEDAARAARYGALMALAKTHSVDKVLLAQHADDQVETLLLALSRGAGLGGLSAMSKSFERGGVWFERPMLSQSAVEIRAWLARENIAYIEDPTNSDTTFTRSKIRLNLLPKLQEAFPQYRATFTRSISHIAQANELLAELAQMDLGVIGIPPTIKGLQTFNGSRQANALRFWLKFRHSVVPSTVQMDELLKQIAACQTRGHQIHLKIASGFVSRAEDRLIFKA